MIVVFNQQGKKKEGNVAAFAINVSQKRKYRSVYLQYLFSEIKHCSSAPTPDPPFWYLLCDLQFRALFL